MPIDEDIRKADHSDWLLRYDHFSPTQEKHRESLCALGNGYFGTRGAAAESDADDVHYPGTYLAGGYNRLTTHTDGLCLENEDLVNLPNWLCLKFRIPGDSDENSGWFDLRQVNILEYCQELNMAEGVLYRNIRFEDSQGRTTRLRERRLVHMRLFHLAATETVIEAENWSGVIEIRSAIDGRVVNDGVARYRPLENQHLEPLGSEVADADTILLKTRTSQSHVMIAQAATTRFSRNGEPVKSVDARRNTIQEPGYVAQQCRIALQSGDRLAVDKVVSLYNSRDDAIFEPGYEALKAVNQAPALAVLFDTHIVAWQQLWERFNIEIDCVTEDMKHRPSLILHLHIFHMLQTATPNTQQLDVGVPARGWTGEAYRGHIFWDELFIFPFLNLRMPEITRGLLMYRYHRLEAARALAKAAGYRGAMYPWQSASNGEETTPTWLFNPKSGNWMKDNSHLQRHVNAAIAHNIRQYYQVTGDLEFMASAGGEILLELARFWASIAEHNPARDRYEIRNVMGPDEYHDRFPPDSGEPGLNNNSYTNVMAAWTIIYALELLDVLPEDSQQSLCKLLALEPEELRRWDEISRNMYVGIGDDGIIEQFEGFRELKEFPRQDFQNRHTSLFRLDLILEAEGSTVNQYQVSKQADVLMLFYLFSSEELQEIFGRMGIAFAPEFIPRNIDYYLKRDSLDSTLSRVANAWVLARSNRPRSWEIFTEALESDIADIQGGTTPEGIHLGAMAGTVDIIQRCYTGIVTRGNVLWLNPCLPDSLTRMRFRLHYRKQSLDVTLSHKMLQIGARPGKTESIRVGVDGKIHTLKAGETLQIQLREKEAVR